MAEWLLPFPDSDITCAHGVKDKLHPNGHRGTDYGKGSAHKGAPIKAISTGKIVLSEWHDNLGNVVVQRLKTGKFAYFCHLLEPGLPVGTVAKVGTVIGKIGNTGHYSFGAHLHCGISDDVKGVYMGKVESLPAYVKAQLALAPKAPVVHEKPVVKPVAAPAEPEHVEPQVKPVEAAAAPSKPKAKPTGKTVSKAE